MSDISRRSRDCICQSFFSRVNLYDSNPFRRNKSTSRLCRSARSRRDVMHGSSIRSLLRTNERSTCSKSSIYRNMSIDYFPWVTLVHKVDGKTYSLSSEASLSICPRLPWVTLRSKQKQQQNENGGLLWKRVAAWVQTWPRKHLWDCLEWGVGEGVVAEAKISELIMFFPEAKINLYFNHPMQIFLPFHWPRTHHLTCK